MVSSRPGRTTGASWLTDVRQNQVPLTQSELFHYLWPAPCWDTVIWSIALHRFMEAWVRSNTWISRLCFPMPVSPMPVSLLCLLYSCIRFLQPICHPGDYFQRTEIDHTLSEPPQNNTHFFACDDHGHTAQHSQCNHDVANLYPGNVPCSVEDLRPVEDRADFPFCSSLCKMGSWGDGKWMLKSCSYFLSMYNGVQPSLSAAA